MYMLKIIYTYGKMFRKLYMIKKILKLFENYRISHTYETYVNKKILLYADITNIKYWYTRDHYHTLYDDILYKADEL